MRTHWLLGGLAISVLVLSGCDASNNYLDPYQKPYAWHPTGAPTANLAAQLVNPRDLAVGRGATDGDAKEATMAIERVWQDKGKSIIAAGDGGGASAAAGGGAGGSN
jgi:type IV pilus biogenesis protein CpaD/CtpE